MGAKGISSSLSEAGIPMEAMGISTSRPLGLFIVGGTAAFGCVEAAGGDALADGVAFAAMAAFSEFDLATVSAAGALLCVAEFPSADESPSEDAAVALAVAGLAEVVSLGGDFSGDVSTFGGAALACSAA